MSFEHRVILDHNEHDETFTAMCKCGWESDPCERAEAVAMAVAHDRNFDPTQYEEPFGYADAGVLW